MEGIISWYALISLLWLMLNGAIFKYLHFNTRSLLPLKTKQKLHK